MTKFEKTQKWLSILPGFSTIFIVFVTIFRLKQKHAPRKLWFSFFAVFFLSAILVYLINIVVMSGQYLMLNITASGLILAIANILFVDIQVKSTQVTGSAKNKFWGPVFFIVLCIFAGAVFVITMISTFLSYPSVDIEDTNGIENTELATISLDEILTISDNYSSFISNESKSGNKTKIQGQLKKYDYQEIIVRSQKISGIKILQATKSSYNNLLLEIESQLNSGNMEIIIIIDDQYYDHFPVNQHASIFLSGIKDKTILVKIATESANANLYVKRTEKD